MFALRNVRLFDTSLIYGCIQYFNQSVFTIFTSANTLTAVILVYCRQFWYESPERKCGFSKKNSYGKIDLSNFAIRSLGLRIRSLELDNSFSRIAIRSSNKDVRQSVLSDCNSVPRFIQSVISDCNSQPRFQHPTIRGNESPIRENGLHNSI